ncbi:MAG: A/G-specific adenine glycosylase [bacterium]|nr:A/G-specific adenine glycosylase [bacterium]
MPWGGHAEPSLPAAAASPLASFVYRPAVQGDVKEPRNAPARLRNNSPALAVSEVQVALLAWYRAHGRHALPWRVRFDPYRILVSEVMLQQTQVERVVPKFESFLELFPSFASLAEAATAEVVRAWRGLGYNRRAVRLQAIARAVVERHAGRLPSATEALLSLPGVGAYTAAALRAFAFDLDDAAVDTNVRRVVHRLAFGVEHPPRAGDRELAVLALALVPGGIARDWNSAMMDLGATVCTARVPRCTECPLRAQCAAAPLEAAALHTAARARPPRRGPQQRLRFEATTRYARGRIVDRLRALAHGERVTIGELAALLGRDDVSALVEGLERDGLATVDEGCVRLPAP